MLLIDPMEVSPSPSFVEQDQPQGVTLLYPVGLVLDQRAGPGARSSTPTTNRVTYWVSTTPAEH